MKKLLLLFLSILSTYSFANNILGNESIYEIKDHSKKYRKSPFQIVNNIPLTTKGFSNKDKLNDKEIATKKLSFVGFVKKKSTICALIKYPNGRIERIKQGDYLGHQRKIIRIDEDFVEIEEKPSSSQGKIIKTILAFPKE